MGQNHRLLISNVFTIGFAKRRSVADRRCHPSSTETISRQLLKPDSAQLLYEVICSSPLQLPVPDPLQPMQDIVLSSRPETPVPDSPQPMQEIVSSQPLQPTVPDLPQPMEVKPSPPPRSMLNNEDRTPPTLNEREISYLLPTTNRTFTV